MIDQRQFPLPVFPKGAVMVLPMSTAMQKYEREAVLGVLLTAAAEAGEWRAVGFHEFKRLAARAVPHFLQGAVVGVVQDMARDGLVALDESTPEGSVAPTPALLNMLEAKEVYLDYTFEADRLDGEAPKP